jgi:hypothetical protein
MPEQVTPRAGRSQAQRLLLGNTHEVSEVLGFEVGIYHARLALRCREKNTVFTRRLCYALVAATILVVSGSACGGKTPTPTPAPTVTAAPTATATWTPSPTPTATPTPVFTPQASHPTFEELAAARTNLPATTRQELWNLVRGQSVAMWRGQVSEVAWGFLGLGDPTVWIDVPGVGTERDISYVIPRDQADRYQKGQFVTLGGTVDTIHDSGSLVVAIKNPVVELGPAPVTPGAVFLEPHVLRGLSPTPLPTAMPFAEFLQLWQDTGPPLRQRLAAGYAMGNRYVDGWEGTVCRVEDAPEFRVRVNMTGDQRCQDVAFAIPSAEAYKFHPGQAVSFSGSIVRVDLTGGDFAFVIGSPIWQLGPDPDAPTRTPRPTMTPTPSRTPTQTPTLTPSVTPRPTATVPPTVTPIPEPSHPTFEEIAAARNDAGLTDVQKKAFLAGLKGQRVTYWQGQVDDVSSFLGSYTVWVDMPGQQGHRGIAMSVPKEEAVKYYIGQTIRFSGTIVNLHSFLGSWIDMSNVTTEFGPIPTRAPTATRRP